MSVEYNGMEFDRLGHASVRIETNDGTVIYIDPWSDVLNGEPNDGDIIIVTHDDFDHYDPEGIAAVQGADVTIAAYEEVDTSDIDADVIDLPYEGTTTVAGIEVESVPAYNDPDGPHVRDNGNPFHADGEVIGVILSLDGTSVYFTSDTDFLPLHEDITVDVIIPPIGGHYTMDREEAAEFARSVDASLVLPVHYDTFEAIETDENAFIAELDADGIRAELF
jgi:L-ascorbate metabolism protein UlaG (beta-lactamase superfamily)